MLKKIFILVVVVAASLIAMNWVWHVKLFSDMCTAVCGGKACQGDFITQSLVIGAAVQALVMGIMFRLGFRDGSPIWEGFRFGLWTGALLVAVQVIPLCTGCEGNMGKALLFEGIFLMVQSTIAGTIIGMIWGVEAAT